MNVEWAVVNVCCFLCSFDADVDDMDEDEPIDDIENPEVFICTTFCLPVVVTFIDSSVHNDVCTS